MQKSLIFKKFFPPSLLIAAATFPFIEVVRSGFFLMDDFGVLYLSKKLCLSDLFSSSFYFSYGNYGFVRPLGLLLWKADFLLYGFNPTGYFVTNLVLHVCCTLLVAYLTFEVSKNRTAGLFAGLLFAVHPAHAEPLGWLSCRYDLASTAFYLAGLIAVVRSLREEGMEWKWYTAAALFETLAILSKEMAVTFPVVVTVYVFLFQRYGWKRKLSALSPFFIIPGFFFLVRLFIFKGIGGYGKHLSIPHANELITRLGYYLITLLFDFNLDYPYHVIFLCCLLSVAFLTALMGYFVSSWNKKIFIYFFFLITFVSFLPLLNFSRITEKFFINARYMYLPSAFLCAALGLLFAPDESMKKWLRLLLPAALVITTAAFLATLYNNNKVWLNKSILSRSILMQFRAGYPETIKSFDITAINFPENIFGRNYYIPKNLARALFFIYNEGHFTVESGQNQPGRPFQYSKYPRPGYTRKIVLGFYPDPGNVVFVYDSQKRERARQSPP